MNLKLKTYCFGVPLFYALSTIHLSPLGRCEPIARSWEHASSSAPDIFRSGVSSAGLPGPAGRWLQHRGNLGTGEGTSGSSEKRRQTEGERTSGGNCSGGTIKRVVPGRFYVTGQVERSPTHGGFQSDSAATVQAQESEVNGIARHDYGSKESWQTLEPSVECGDEAMTLTVRRKRAMQLLLDRVNGSSLPLVQLPPQCGYSVRSSWRDLTLVAQYDACHVIREDDGYVLPLLWRGIPAKVSCPVQQFLPSDGGPSSLCCSPNGMTVKLQGGSATKDPRVNVRGEWTPLGLLAKRCDYTLDSLDAEMIVGVPFITCGITIKDGKSMLLLKMGEDLFMLACPTTAFGDLSATDQPLADSPPDLPRKLPKPESLRPFLFMPPFYLAPPYYPHPTYHHGQSQNKEWDTYNPPTPHSFTSEADFSSDQYYQQMSLKDKYENLMTQKPLSSKAQADSSGLLHQDQNQVISFLDLSKNGITPTGLPSQHPSHDFSSYYHYYHHPKIPLPGAPLPVSGLQTPSGSHKYQLLSTLPNIQLSEGLKDGNDQISLPVKTQTTSKVTADHSPYLPHPFPFYLLYHPHLAMGNVQRPAKTNLSSTRFAFSTVVPNPEKQRNIPNINGPDKGTEVEHSFKPKLQEQASNSQSTFVTPAVQSLTPHTPDPVAVPPDKPLFPTPGFTYNADPYKYYYHPYYNYYLKYYTPEALRGAYNNLAQTSSEPSSVHPSHLKYQTSSPPSEPGYGVRNSLMFPYYYYYHYYLPQLLHYYHMNHPDGKDSDKDSTSLLSSNLDHHELQRFSLASDHRHSTDPPWMSKGFHQALSSYAAWHVRGVKEDFDDYMKVAPPASSSENRKAPCKLLKLSSDPDLYLAPLDGCSENKHMPGQIMAHQSDVQGILPNGGRDYFPVRLMVGCTPASPGEVRSHKTDISSLPTTEPPPYIAAVVLRIATDGSFTSFYPKAHLPISLMQDKPVHMELRLLEPTEPTLVLLVHSCIAYTVTPEVYWMLFYDSCSSQSISQLLPSPNAPHIWRLNVSSFPSLPPVSDTDVTHRGSSALGDPEVYFLCHTELCSTLYGECGMNCN